MDSTSDMDFEIENHELENKIYIYKSKKHNKDNSFMQELSNLQFKENIKTEAFNVYKKMEVNTKRKQNRLGLMFVCIYHACRILGEPLDPKIIADKVGLKGANLCSYLKMFSYENTGYKNSSTEISPRQFIKDYYEQT